MFPTPICFYLVPELDTVFCLNTIIRHFWSISHVTMKFISRDCARPLLYDSPRSCPLYWPWLILLTSIKHFSFVCFSRSITLSPFQIHMKWDCVFVAIKLSQNFAIYKNTFLRRHSIVYSNLLLGSYLEYHTASVTVFEKQECINCFEPWFTQEMFLLKL